MINPLKGRTMLRLARFAPLFLLAACASTEPKAPAPSPEVVKQIAPSGKLRAAMNFGNAVLAQKGPSGEAKGISVDLATELARRLGVPLDPVYYDAAGKVAAGAKKGEWDVGFVALDPERAQDIDFTAAYVVIEGGYMVRVDSPLKAVEDFDRKGQRIVVGNKSVYDLYLTRTIKNAELVRAPTTPLAQEEFLADKARKFDGLAGIKGPMMRYADAHPAEVRVIPGRFMAIEQAMALPKGRDPAALAYLKAFVEEQKASGFVARGLERSGQSDANVAPLAAK